jgi:hypothetical protein
MVIVEAPIRKHMGLHFNRMSGFRLYSIVTLVAMIGFGMASGIAIRGIEQNDAPWAGAFERINAYVFMAWLVVLAVTVWTRKLDERSQRLEGSGGLSHLAFLQKARVRPSALRTLLVGRSVGGRSGGVFSKP